MGRAVDLNSPLSEEDKQYLRDRGRGYLIPANERRFGADGTETPDENEGAGAPAVSPFYDNAEREKAVYDVGGAKLPGTVLDYDTGRVADRENGVLVEFAGPGHTPGAHDLSAQREPEGFTSYAVDEQGNPVDDNIDEDIVQKVLEFPNVGALKTALVKKKVEVPPDAKREDLENLLAVTLQDERDASKAKA